MTTKRSEAAFETARTLLPGGVSSPVRAFGAVGGTPRFAARGAGSSIFDLDGNRYLDLCCSWGALILGHAHPLVVDAIERAARDGTSFGAPTVAETTLASEIWDAMPGLERVRFVSSGTEAAMTALRLARAATGRDGIVKFAGCYHGHSDALLAAAGSGALTLGLPDSPGVTAGAAGDTHVVTFGDLDAVRAACAARGIAAVIVEPVAANMGVVPPPDGFLAGLRAICDDTGTLLVADEVITGFRVGRAGAMVRAGVRADLTVLGKIVGGGMPLAAIAGPAKLMDQLAPIGPVYQAGTLSGNPISVAAGLATLRALRDQDPYPQLEVRAATLADGLAKAAADAGVAVQVQRDASMLTVFFTDAPVTDLASATRSDTQRFARWFHALLDNGVWWPPSQFEAAFVSAALTDEDVDRVVLAASRASATVANHSG